MDETENETKPNTETQTLVKEYTEKHCFSDILSPEFLQKYAGTQPEWGFDGLGYIVYRRTYARKIYEGVKEEWWQTVARCINGAQKIGARYTKEEAERLFDLVFNLKCSWAGRMLWQLNTPTVDRFFGNSLLNCWYTDICKPEDFLFIFENLMLGGGVGFSVRREDVHELPRIRQGVQITHNSEKDADFIVPDSREGWVEALRHVLNAFFVTGKSFSYSTIIVRGAGEPIKGFGGTASGPGILAQGIEQISGVLRSREGKKLRSVDALDICNIIGSVVVAGNVRRCLPGEARVYTENGLRRIDTIQKGDRVLTSYGYKPVSQVFDQGYQETVVIRAEKGPFECTPNHRMAVFSEGKTYEWKRADELGKNDSLVATVDCPLCGDYPPKMCPAKIKKIEPGRVTHTYDIEVEDIHEFYCEGYLTHNSAEIAIGDPDDYLFIRAKNWSTGKIPNWRDKSNNTIQADSFDAISDEVWTLGYIPDSKTGMAKGEPYGFFNQPLSQKFGRLKDGPLKVKDNCRGMNPCFSGDTLIAVADGRNAVSMRELAERDEDVPVYAVNPDTGKVEIKTARNPRKTGTGRDMVRVWLDNGSYLDVTPDHKFPVKNGETKQAENLLKGDSLFPFRKSPERLSDKNDNEYYRVSCDSGKTWETFRERDTLEYDMYDFEQNSHKTKTLQKAVSQGYEAEIEDGEVYVKKNCEYSGEPFWTEWNQRNISFASRENFNAHLNKNSEVRKKDYRELKEAAECYNHKVVSVERLEGKHDVFNLTVDDHHTVGVVTSAKNNKRGNTIFDGVFAFQCGEITLADGECCNLVELFLNKIKSKAELFDCAKLLYKTQKAIAAMPFLHDKTNKIVHKNMRLGMGVTGVTQALDKVDWLDECYEMLRNFDREWSKKNGWPESIKLTTVKPSGTVSLLSGSSPGAHRLFSKYFIRRVRIASHDPLVKLCNKMGYHSEFARRFDGSEDHDTVVVSFPCCAENADTTEDDGDVIEQLELVKKLQTIWSDNSVSVTAYYDENDLDQVKEWLKDNYNDCVKSASFLLRSKHGFVQAPLEKIDQKTYEKMRKRIKPVEQIKEIDVGSELLKDVECEGGACPVR